MSVWVGLTAMGGTIGTSRKVGESEAGERGSSGKLMSGGCADANPASQKHRTSRLARIGPGNLGARAVVRRFLRNGNVMRMALLHRRGAHHDKAGARPQLLD